MTQEPNHEEWNGHTKGFMFLLGANRKNLSVAAITSMSVCSREETVTERWRKDIE